MNKVSNFFLYLLLCLLLVLGVPAILLGNLITISFAFIAVIAALVAAAIIFFLDGIISFFTAIYVGTVSFIKEKINKNKQPGVIDA